MEKLEKICSKCGKLKDIGCFWRTTAIALSYGEGPEYVGNLEKGDKIL